MEERGDGVLRFFRLLRGGTVDNEVAVEGVRAEFVAQVFTS